MQNKLLPFLFLAQLLLCLIIGTVAASAQSKSDSTAKHIDINAEANYLRHYVWRGINFGGDDVSQSFVTASYGKWSANFCVNYNLFPNKLPKEFYTKKVHYDEQDVILTYASSFHKFQFECNSNTYLYFHQIDCPSTSELSLKMMYPLSEKWSVFSENVTDVWSHKNAYYNATGVEGDYTFKDELYELDMTLYTATANKYFNDAYFGEMNNGFNLVGTHIELSRFLKHDYYVKCFVEFNQFCNKGIIEASGMNHTSNYGFSFGKNLSYKLKHHKADKGF